MKIIMSEKGEDRHDKQKAGSSYFETREELERVHHRLFNGVPAFNIAGKKI